MDGMTNAARDAEAASSIGRAQRTLKSAICCVGIGLHSGARVHVTLRPAAAGTGIVFRRIDLGVDVPARFDHVVDTLMCTVLAAPGQPDVRVGTVEHLMAALAGCGITNIVAELDGAELPVLDGSAAPWMFLLDCAGTVAQEDAVTVVEVLRPVRVTDGAASAELRPGAGLHMAMAIEFAAGAIGRQALSLSIDGAVIRHELAEARTFTMLDEVAALQAAGLARGGSLDNAIVVDGARVLNPGGLRMTEEFVRHKMLDAVGDLALAGVALQGRFVGHCSGHSLNNRVLRALFADPANYRVVPAPDLAGEWVPATLQAA